MDATWAEVPKRKTNPTDPTAASREIAHLLLASQGLHRICIGLCFLVLVALFATLCERPFFPLLGACAIAGAILVVKGPLLIYRLRARKGLAVFPRARHMLFGRRSWKEPNSNRRRLVWLLVLAVGLGCGLALGLDIGLAGLLSLGAAAVVDTIYGFLLLRLWEDVVETAYVLVGVILGVSLSSDGTLDAGVAFTIWGAGLVLLGTWLHLRWRRWVRSLPEVEPAPAPEAFQETPDRSAPATAEEKLDICTDNGLLLVTIVLNACEIADLRFLLGATGLSLTDLCSHILRLGAAGYVVAKTEEARPGGDTVYQLTETGRASCKTCKNAREATGGQP